MHINTITSAVLLSLASASVILATPTSSKRAADLGLNNKELGIRNVDAVPGCPFNCNEDGCDLCAPPSPSEVRKDKRNELDLIPVRFVERNEDVICVPGQPPPIGDVLVCTGLGCVHCPPEGEKEKVKRQEVDLIPMRFVEREEDVICIPGQPPPLVCTGLGCVHCPPEEEQVKVKREEKRAAKFCSPSCVGEHCHCEDEGEQEIKPVESRGPPEVATEKAKRGERVCIPHCVGEHCSCEEEEEKIEKAKRGEKVCIPHCVGEHCSCEEEEDVEA